jgi:DUF971 family protein
MESGHTPLRPANITVDKTHKRLRILWADGHESTYAFEELRAACPCAECQAYRAKDSPLRSALLISTGLDSAQLVGNYAIQFQWDDGHRFGIFTWEYLRSLE